MSPSALNATSNDTIPEAGGTTLSPHTHVPLAPPPPSALLLRAALLALGAAHAYALARLLVRHVLERAFWRGGEAARTQDHADRAVKARVLRGLGADQLGGLGEALDGLGVEEEEDEKEKGEEGFVLQGAKVETEVGGEEDVTGFWARDEGLDEIKRDVKDA